MVILFSCSSSLVSQKKADFKGGCVFEKKRELKGLISVSGETYPRLYHTLGIVKNITSAVPIKKKT